jgi:anti-anti-sigma factor
MINFEHHSGEKHLICRFSGHLDTIACVGISEALQQKLQELKQGHMQADPPEEKIDFDMRDVTFISSSFIRICLVAFNALIKGNFTIINCDPFLKKTFKIAGLDELLHVS